MISEFIDKIKSNPTYKGQIIFQKTIPAKKPQFGTLTFSLAPELKQWLKENDWELYSHQADALNLINEGRNVVITTSTASGKTLIFSLAVAQAVTQKINTTALFLYPMKALANDQLTKMEELNVVLEGRLRPFVYDGDTPSEKRPVIRNTARVVISNPYAFHRYLDWHSKWERFFRNLRFIVIDEAHTYRGVFGSNVAQLIRRLQRICEFYRSHPQFILSSATISNPKDFTEKLIGTSVHVVTNDGSQQSSKELIIWNPPFIDQFELERRSPHQETRDILLNHLREHYQTLCFTLSRKMSEIITVWARQDLEQHELDPEQVMTYRAGYRPLERRKIENQLRNRQISAVVSTNALEVGIDIGNLDAVILSGFPGTIISTWQQIGRVGRTTRPSLATLILFEDAYQQFLGRHPEYFLERTPENAIIDLGNPYIVKGHMLCAAAELPIKKTEINKIWGKVGSKAIKELLKQDILKLVPAGIVPKSIRHPSQQISLNSAFADSIEIIVKGKLLETMTTAQAYREAHEGAIIIHQGEKYLVKSINWEIKKAYASHLHVDYYTEAISTSEVEILTKEREKDIGYPLVFGEVKVTEFYHSYKKKTYEEILDIIPLNLPPLEFNTKAVWIQIPSDLVEKIKFMKKDFSGGIHALEHATIALSPLFALCDRWDIGGTSYPNYPEDGTTKIFIYDGFPGGIGIAEKLFEKWNVLLSNVQKLIHECPCKEGCPSCIQSPKCGNDNYPLSKEVALELLKELMLLSKN